MNSIDGILFIDKEEGITSFDVVRLCKKRLKTKKVGHAGTLDPFASGLLIIGVGSGTKVLSILENDRKTYIGTAKFGVLTDSFDLDGNVIEEKDVPKLDIDNVKCVLNSFVGKYIQTPPIYSALKKNGKPMYEYARNGIKVELKAREQFIYNLEFVSLNDNQLTFIATVNKGTYIRVLANDIANKLGTVGHLVSLRRLSVGNCTLDKAISTKDICLDNLLSIENALSYIPSIEIGEEQRHSVEHGQDVKLNYKNNFVLIKSHNKIVGLYESKGEGIYHCKRGFVNEDN